MKAQKKEAQEKAKREQEQILKDMINEDAKVQENTDVMFQQYKLYVDMADKISARRAATNNFFLTANSFLFVALGVLFSYKFWYFIPLVLLVGVFFCLSWFLLIQYYKSLNSAKFKIINEIEEYLPVKGFSTEWKLWKAHEKPFRTRSLSNIEKWIPLSLGLMYFLAAMILIIITIFFSDILPA